MATKPQTKAENQPIYTGRSVAFDGLGTAIGTLLA
jgi:hypothetical protein